MAGRVEHEVVTMAELLIEDHGGWRSARMRTADGQYYPVRTADYHNEILRLRALVLESATALYNHNNITFFTKYPDILKDVKDAT